MLYRSGARPMAIYLRIRTQWWCYAPLQGINPYSYSLYDTY